MLKLIKWLRLRLHEYLESQELRETESRNVIINNELQNVLFMQKRSINYEWIGNQTADDDGSGAFCLGKREVVSRSQQVKLLTAIIAPTAAIN